MRTARPDPRRGFTLVEVLLVCAILALLAIIVVPQYTRAVKMARAADAIAELQVVRVAVMTYQTEHHTFPPDRARGVIPPGLGEFLPEGYSFSGEDYVIDYDHWPAPGGMIGLTFITSDQEVGRIMLGLLGDDTWTNGARKFTWVVEWLD